MRKCQSQTSHVSVHQCRPRPFPVFNPNTDTDRNINSAKHTPSVLNIGPRTFDRCSHKLVQMRNFCFFCIHQPCLSLFFLFCTPQVALEKIQEALFPLTVPCCDVTVCVLITVAVYHVPASDKSPVQSHPTLHLLMLKAF